MLGSRNTLSLHLVIPLVLALCALSCTTTTPPPPLQEHLSVKLISVKSPVSPGNAASITIKTAPSAECTITVTYKSGPSQAQGLDPKTADNEGIVSWAWIVGTRTTPGEWPIRVTCSAGSEQSTLETLFSVQ